MSALFERTPQALGEEEKKSSLKKAEKRDRLVGGRWVAAFSRLHHIAGFRNKRCGRWKKGGKKAGNEKMDGVQRCPTDGQRRCEASPQYS